MLKVSKAVFGRALGLSTAAVLLSTTVALAEDPETIAGDIQRIAEVPMEVATEGPTLQQRQDEMVALKNWLAGETPAVALRGSIRVELTPAEIDSVENPQAVDGEPLKVGVVIPLAERLDVVGLSRAELAKQARGSRGGLDATRDAGVVWAVPVSSANAGAIRVHVENMFLPGNAELYFYSPTGEAYGPYTGRGPEGSGEFWTASVFGSEGVLQLRLHAPVTNADLANVSLSVTEIGHIARTFFSFGGGEGSVAAFCQYNASCIQNGQCVNEPAVSGSEGAVAKMLWIAGPYIYTCSGGLMADTVSGTQIPYFLTANHCISKNNNAANLEAFFGYQVSCGTTNCPNQWNDPPSNLITGKTTGATVKATGRRGDFTLLQLSQAPPAGSVFLGWTNSPVANSNGVPLYRISHPSGAPQAYSDQTVSTSAPVCQGWPRGERIYSRGVNGATEGGSSGSPVVNGSGQVVGQLSGSCGTNNSNVCNHTANATVDGAFAYYYNSVQPFLAP